jgi:hypothetical protein
LSKGRVLFLDIEVWEIRQIWTWKVLKHARLMQARLLRGRLGYPDAAREGWDCNNTCMLRVPLTHPISRRKAMDAL